MEDNGFDKEELNAIMEMEYNKVKVSGLLDYGFVIKLQNEKDYTKWDMIMKAPEDSEYKGAQYKLEIEFLIDYPYTNPKIIFKTPIYHCNVKDNGELDVNWMCEGMPIDYILPRLLTLFYLPEPLVNKNSERAKLFKDNKDEFEKNVKKHVEQNIKEQKIIEQKIKEQNIKEQANKV